MFYIQPHEPLVFLRQLSLSSPCHLIPNNTDLLPPAGSTLIFYSSSHVSCCHIGLVFFSYMFAMCEWVSSGLFPGLHDWEKAPAAMLVTPGSWWILLIMLLRWKSIILSSYLLRCFLYKQGYLLFRSFFFL